VHLECLISLEQHCLGTSIKDKGKIANMKVIATQSSRFGQDPPDVSIRQLNKITDLSDVKVFVADNAMIIHIDPVQDPQET
jgi:hypothetical protein